MNETPMEKAYNYIEKKIINKEWTAGEKITSEVRLAVELGVSRVSVRSAIEKLVALDILNKIKGSGSYVNEINNTTHLNKLIPFMTIGGASYIEILEYRSYMDVLSVELFIENCTNDNKIKLEEIVEKMKNTREREEFFLLDMDFHHEIAKGSRNNILIKINQILYNILKNRYKDEYHRLTYEKRVEEHKEILDAILEKNIKTAKLYTKLHVLRSLEDLRKMEL
ncbi:MAG: FadR family transcriptional regulator [Psychrilyobacter sp.]|nr:FadR family transcriptional regulator [Psychrilyobacter sp.]